MRLKYGTNPHQTFAELEPGASAPLAVRSGTPSLINLLDGLNAWQLVRELKHALGLPAAASFKHVSPAGAALGLPLEPALEQAYEVKDSELTPLGRAYARARCADPKCSFGDFVALSDPVDESTAAFLAGVVSDGIIAPGYAPGAEKALAAKKGGSFIVLEIDPSYEPPEREAREVFGVRLVQDRNARRMTRADLSKVVCGALTEAAARDLLLGMIALKYTQSNSVGFALGGQLIGIGAGQQSRVDCTKLAGAKADLWFLRQHPRVLALRFRKGVRRQERINWRVRYLEGDLTRPEEAALREALAEPLELLPEEESRAWLAAREGVSLVSDGVIAFRDNIDHAQRHGVRFIAEPGGSVRDDEIEAACREYGITLVRTGVRLFHH